MLSERLLNRVQFVLCEAKILSQTGRPIRAVQLEDGLLSIPNHMDVCRPMVVRVNHNAETRKPQNGRHPFSIPTQTLGLYNQAPVTFFLRT
jgi:hypothetical protein